MIKMVKYLDIYIMKYSNNTIRNYYYMKKAVIQVHEFKGIIQGNALVSLSLLYDIISKLRSCVIAYVHKTRCTRY